MKKRLLSLLVCVCLLVSAMSVSDWAKGNVAAMAARGWAPDPQGILTHSEMDRPVAVLGRLKGI